MFHVLNECEQGSVVDLVNRVEERGDEVTLDLHVLHLSIGSSHHESGDLVVQVAHDGLIDSHSRVGLRIQSVG